MRFLLFVFQNFHNITRQNQTGKADWIPAYRQTIPDHSSVLLLSLILLSVP